MAMRKVLFALAVTCVISVAAAGGDYGISNPTSGANFTHSGFREANRGKADVGKVALTAAFVSQFPALKGLGISAVYFEFGPWSQVGPHTHPRATELFYMIRGILEVGFVDTSNTVFRKRVYKGDLFVFPKGLLHYQRNNWNTTAKGIALLNNENPGLQSIVPALFSSPDAVLAASLHLNASSLWWLKRAVSS